MLTKSFTIAFALLAIVFHAAPARAAPEADTPPWPVAVQQELVQLGRVEWALRAASAPLCAHKAAGLGIVVDSLDAYGRSHRDAVRRAVGLADDPQIVAVMAGSPAQRAGLRKGDALLALDGVPVARIGRQADGATLADAVMDRIAASAPDRAIRLSVRRNGQALSLAVTPQAVCAARVLLKTEDGIEAHSDGENVAISSGLIAFTQGDDELALVIGHEMAHTILHRGKSFGLFSGKAREDEADALGARLASCAGYDVARSLAFWERLARRDRLGFLRLPTHRGAKARAERLRDGLPGLSCPAPKRAGLARR